jgi:hypothetical protein
MSYPPARRFHSPDLVIQPVRFAQVCGFIRQHHRHHAPPQGHKFSLGLHDGYALVGVIVLGRPVSRDLDDGWTLEVTRCCTDSTPNACSKLYSTAARVARLMGYARLLTYTLPSEGGASLRAAGWHVVGISRGGSWSRPRRPRLNRAPLGPKRVWSPSIAPFSSAWTQTRDRRDASPDGPTCRGAGRR